MDGGCRHSPHRGHYWVEEIPETDKWECRWCGEIRHFNQERTARAQMVEHATVANEYVSQEWLHSQLAGKAIRRIREGSLELDLSMYPLLSSG
jgi:hypothetical protein